MRVIYSEPQDVFFQDILTQRVATKMREVFGAADPEFSSWQNSPLYIKNLLELSGVKGTHVTFEYQVPYRQQRIDCMIFGRNLDSVDTVLHIELKQWTRVQPTEVEGNWVETYTGGAMRKVAHPSQQVKGYHDYLLGFVKIFDETNVDLKGYAYCHNYTKEGLSGLYAPFYNQVIEEFPLYSCNQIEEFADKVKYHLGGGNGFDIFNKFYQSPIHPSKKLLENASKIIANESSFALVNEQIVAKNTILSCINGATSNNQKSVVIVKGGPGTGKTVIALNLLAEIANSGKEKSIFFSTKSKPLLEGIKNRLKKGDNSKLLFTNLNQFIPSKVAENEIDVLLIDEAHRISKTSNHQYTKSYDKTDLSQIETLIRASKTSIFFIDDKQVIRNAEIGNTSLIIETAKKFNCKIYTEELLSQFRCNGSDSYIDWLDKVLGINTNAIEFKNLDTKNDFDFKIFNDINELYSTILNKSNEAIVSSRLVAGFCWPWSKKLDPEGNLINDVKIGNFELPWETHGEIKPPEGYVKWYEWAYKPEGIKQVGCIYTAQGFEFDYIGVIVGEDLKYDKINDCLVGDISKTKDPTLKKGKENFDEYVKNIYRVLISRGMKGCYVYFIDKEVQTYFERRIK